ncbi:MAG: hypothetical protein ACRD38_04975 [Nitrososphaerales archaeon]
MKKAILIAIVGLLIATVPALSNTVIPVHAQESVLAPVINLSKNGQSSDPQIAVSGNNVYVGWAWTGAVILMYLSIAEEIVMMVLGNSYGFSIILAAIFLYYLYRPHVKIFFGKVSSTTV